MYTAGPESGKAVILLHEVDGVREPVIELMDCLADAGFRVYMPVFFETSWLPDTPAAVAGLVRVCISREFHVLATGGNSPAASWVRSLAQHVAQDGQQLGVVGMCLTGGLALAAIAESSVGAAVAAQPAMPWANGPWPLGSAPRRRDLGLSTEEEAAVRNGTTPILALRFDRDRKSPRERVLTIGELETGCAVWITDDGKSPPPHATLTAAFRKGEPDVRRASRGAIQQVIEFLDANL